VFYIFIIVAYYIKLATNFKLTGGKDNADIAHLLSRVLCVYLAQTYVGWLKNRPAPFSE
jgi:hypothetical protein